MVTLKKIEDVVWEIPQTYKRGMRVPARVFADEYLLQKMQTDLTLEQAANVAILPGIYKYSIVLPDGHQGYGFPIGGVAAFDYNEGVLSPGGVGYDINCGVRILRTNLRYEDVKDKLRELSDLLFRYIPSGLGSRGRVSLSKVELDRVLADGVLWAVSKGYGWSEDPEYIEERGAMEGADPSKVSDVAKERGREQLGTLGSGNHFLEIQVVDKIYDPKAAATMGIEEVGQVTVMIHTGSRGLGHQVCSDYLRVMEVAVRRYNMPLPDRELVSVPATSREAEDYFAAMKAAANFAWANRQLITHWVREVFSQVFRKSADELDLHIVYDVAHNIAKLEEHVVDGARRKVYVHRKGATRAFPPGHPLVPRKYQSIGQPVLIPGSMGTASYILVGTQKAMEITFGSAPHGAGRVLSREEAKRRYRGSEIKDRLENRGIVVRAASMAVVAEEAPDAYKDVDRVADVADRAGMAKKVVRLVPIAVVKG
ncbi:MAG: RtcB family protein [Thermofilaceae archaeon]